MVSIVIPTYNERDALEDTLKSIHDVLKNNDIEHQLIVVDDDSPDKTWEFCESLKDRYPLKVIRRVGEKGLSSAVIKGWEEADGEILGVMDADGSHDERALPDMVQALKNDECQLAVGSRYVPGGGAKGWPWFRILASKFAILLARWVTNLKDATSGFCLFQKDVVKDVALDPVGWKIVLEVAVKGNYEKRREFPIIFHDRTQGKSKLGSGTMVSYIQHLTKLKKWMKENNREKR